MSTDRQAQARAEAERRYPGGQRRFTQANLQAAFRQGVVWADANPKPHTITRAQCEDAKALLRPDIYGDVTGVEDMLESLGIEVEDDDE